MIGISVSSNLLRESKIKELNKIGKNLFSLVCKKAKKMGAQKLYISAHSSQESQAFYKALGCVEAMEYSDRLVVEEPCDCQLEYKLMQQETLVEYSQA